MKGLQLSVKEPLKLPYRADHALKLGPITGGGGGPSLYLGQVATRCHLPVAVISAKEMMSVSGHFARDTITSLRIAIPDKYLSGTTEFQASGTKTVHASIEYPIGGTPVPLLFAGSAAGSLAAGSTLFSDALAIAIPTGAKFKVRVHRSTTGTSLVCTNTASFIKNNADFGDAATYGATTPDLTGGGVVASADNVMFTPALILAQTRKSSIMTIGDSLGFAFNDTPDASGDVGIIARSIGPTIGYTGMCRAGETVANQVTNSAYRCSFAPYFSDVIIEAAINDLATLLSTGAVVHQARIDLANLVKAQNPSIRIWETTCQPQTNSANTSANEPPKTQKAALNAFVRAGGAPFSGYFDVEDGVATDRVTPLWAEATHGADGTHGTIADYLRMQASGKIDVSRFVRT